MKAEWARSVAALVCLASFFAVCTSPARAEEGAKKPTAQEIVAKANRVAYYQGKDGRAQVSMVITDSQGRERRRRLTILRRDQAPAGGEQDETFAGDQKFYVYFHLPADVRKTVFMVWKHVNRDDDRWLYLPDLDLVKRIAATEERASFVGSDFFYEDVSGRNIAKDDHDLVETTDVYYVLKHTPKNPKSVEFASYKTWIHKDTFVTVKSSYADSTGKEYRVYEALKYEEIQGYPTVTQSRMRDLRTGSQTVIEYKNLAYDIGLPDEIFTERYLRRAPIEYLR